MHCAALTVAAPAVTDVQQLCCVAAKTLCHLGHPVALQAAERQDLTWELPCEGEFGCQMACLGQEASDHLAETDLMIMASYCKAEYQSVMQLCPGAHLRHSQKP